MFHVKHLRHNRVHYANWLNSLRISDSLNIIISLILIINLFRKFGKLKDGDDPSMLGSTIS